MVTDAEDVFASNGTSGPHSNGTRKSSSSAADGTHKPVSSQNGGPQLAKSVSSTYCGHDRQEMTRILVQALSDMGYHSAAESVIKDSGYDLESPVVAAFRTAVCEGSWEEAEKLLFGASSNEEPDEYGNGLVLCPGADRDMMRFWLRRQKFLELLENRDTAKALHVLRKELTPLYQDTSQLQMLSSLLMCSTPELLKDAAHWDGAQGQSRRELLSRLSTYISPSVMLPEHRLASLLHQSKRAQIARCLYHSDTSAPSLYSDHMCHRRDFPLEAVLVLDKHDGEVWQIKFSHDGKRLATCGLDKQVIIWDVPSFDVVHVLKEHELGVGNIAWSPDDSLLVTCSQDRHARLWDMRSGSLIRRLPRQEEPVSSCAWYPDSQHFVTGALDKSLSICQWNRSGDKTLDWDKKHRVEDLVLSPDGRWLVAMDDNHHIHIYDSATREKEHELDLNARVYSVSVSQDSKHLLVNNQYGEIKLYDIGSWEVIQDYQTALGDNYVIRSGFGGADQSFVISGGEDGELYIFHRTTGVKVASMHAHRPRCNSVSWSPKDPQMLATCGDDGKIKIWSTKEHIRNISSRPSYSNGNGWRNEEDED